MNQQEIFLSVCSKCKKLSPHLVYLVRINKGIKLISVCHDAIAKRYTRFDLLKPYDTEKALEQAEKELESQENQLNKEEMEVEQAKGG